MYDYLVDRLARDHADALMADAAAARRTRRVRRERRAAQWTQEPSSDRSPASPHRGAVKLAAHPVAVLHSWLAAGQL
jgi:hypothetical protein